MRRILRQLLPAKTSQAPTLTRILSSVPPVMYQKHYTGMNNLLEKSASSKSCFKDEWKLRFLMLPVSVGSSKSCDSEDMICIQCQERTKTKCSTAKRHIQRKHPTLTSFSEQKRKKLLRIFEGQLKDQQSSMASATKPNEMVKLASYKLAFVISKHKMPFTSCEAFM